MDIPAPAAEGGEIVREVLRRFDEEIVFYRHAAGHNRNAYKLTRYLSIVLGATVTLLSALSAANIDKTLVMATPFIAAALTIAGGISQSFQWGAAWSDMALTAARLEKERDRIRVTPPAQLDAVREVALLNDLVVTETQSFFQRLFGSNSAARGVAP